MTDPIAESAQARVGTTLKDKWRLDKLLGVGGMAAVYSSTHRNGMRVAIKVLHASLSADKEIRTRFLREGYLANKVNHSGAVAVLDDQVDDDGSVFLVMELLEGQTLAGRTRRLTIEEILVIADDLLDVLAAAHEKKIVHRDIKPDNIFLLRSGGIKLLDFGIARLRELSTKTTATRTGAAMGTPAYMAPEQARARWGEVDARTDVWAVGATLFKLLTGRVVHEAYTVNEQLLAAMTRPAPSVGSLLPTAPPPVIQIVDRALAFEKKDRWPDARTMQQAVRSAYQGLTGKLPNRTRLSFDDAPPVSALAPTIASDFKPTGPGPRRWFASMVRKSMKAARWALALAAVALVAAVYVYMKRRDRPENLSAPIPRDSVPEAGVAAPVLPSRRDSPTDPPRPATQPSVPKEKSRTPRTRPRK